MMRIQIREQLALLILLSALIGLAVVSLAVWFTNYNFVLDVRASRLSYVAALKAGQLGSNLHVMETAVNFISSRVLIQQALIRYNGGNNTASNWPVAVIDFQAAIGSTRSLGQAILHQTMIFAKEPDGPGGIYGLLNVTESAVLGQIELPYKDANGSSVYLGDPGLGYPPNLYPNITYSSGAAFVGDVQLNETSPNLVLGPWPVNDTYALMSITTAIANNADATDILGYLTVLMDAALIRDIVLSTSGLDSTGETLIVTPSNITNRVPRDWSDNSSDIANMLVQYVTLPPQDAARHPNHIKGTDNPPFRAGSYPAVVQAFRDNATTPEASSSLIGTHNEHGDDVSTGFASVDSMMVDWVILVEHATSEVWQPINNLRNILLACVFGTAGFILVISFPLAHFAVMPIRRLREATRRSVAPKNASRSSIDSCSTSARHHDGADNYGADIEEAATIIARKEGFGQRVKRWRTRGGRVEESRLERQRKREFRIPGKVKERKLWVKDELSDLTMTFNEMSDELMTQYSKLEERVQQRTAELEVSKKAAEVANESKTLFIANISHELKTPLNGILGMCAICMQEDDPVKLRRELGVIYKSGDLLLNLLNDLLQFTRNQVGQQISLEEREFKLRDVSSQILAIFRKQATDSQINLQVEFHAPDGAISDGNASDTDKETSNAVDADLGRLKEHVLWGDIHRILQVLINLTSNSLKFTPPGGSVTLRIKCLAKVPHDLRPVQPSIASRHSKGRRPLRQESSTSLGVARTHSPRGSLRKKSSAVLGLHERPSTPPPAGRWLYFEFQVEDTGPGIPQDQQQRVFEPFMQGDLGLNRKYGGTGLGLSICSQLATLMGGKIGVESTVGVGSTFTMVIPLRHVQTRKDSKACSTFDADRPHVVQRTTSSDDIESILRRPAQQQDAEAMSALSDPGVISSPDKDSQPRLIGLSQPFFAATDLLETRGAQAAAIERVTANVARGGRIRVLVAEDNKVNQEVVLRMLKLEDIYDVTMASDGQMALDLVKENMAQDKPPFNLIFMDVQMPNVDGIQSTRLIREMGYSAPIVALTAFAEESNVKDCLDSGMNYFLSKPIRRPQLKKVLKEYCAPIPEENEDMRPSPSEAGTQVPPSALNHMITIDTPSGEFGAGSPQKEEAKASRLLLKGF